MEQNLAGLPSYRGTGGGVPMGGADSRVTTGNGGTMSGRREVGVAGRPVLSPGMGSLIEVGSGQVRSGVTAEGVGALSSGFGLGSSLGKAFTKSTMLASM